MKKQEILPPTDAEVEILAVLWDGPKTVREVREALRPTRPVGYTTVLKALQVMDTKGLVIRDKSQKAHVYRARLPERQTQRKLLSHLLHRAFGGSYRKLVMGLFAGKKASPESLAEIRRTLEELERGEK